MNKLFTCPICSMVFNVVNSKPGTTFTCTCGQKCVLPDPPMVMMSGVGKGDPDGIEKARDFSTWFASATLITMLIGRKYPIFDGITLSLLVASVYFSSKLNYKVKYWWLAPLISTPAIALLTIRYL